MKLSSTILQTYLTIPIPWNNDPKYKSLSVCRKLLFIKYYGLTRLVIGQRIYDAISLSPWLNFGVGVCSKKQSNLDEFCCEINLHCTIVLFVLKFTRVSATMLRIIYFFIWAFSGSYVIQRDDCHPNCLYRDDLCIILNEYFIRSKYRWITFNNTNYFLPNSLIKCLSLLTQNLYYKKMCVDLNQFYGSVFIIWSS